MKVVRNLTAYHLHHAVIQAVGELQNFGQDVRVADVAQFLGCSKPTATYHLRRMVMFKLITMQPRSYRSNASMYTIELAEAGRKLFNSQVAIEAKSRVFAMRGVL